MDKNPDEINEIIKIISEHTKNWIFYEDTFGKVSLLNVLFDHLDEPIVYVDFDLLYSGYVEAKIIPAKQRFSVLQPTIKNWNELIPNLLERISEEKLVLVIDSFNGLYNFVEYEGSDGRLGNSLIMLFACLAKISNSIILIPCMSRLKEKKWVLSITGRRVLENRNDSKFQLVTSDSKFEIDLLKDDNSKSKSFAIFKN